MRADLPGQEESWREDIHDQDVIFPRINSVYFPLGANKGQEELFLSLGCKHGQYHTHSFEGVYVTLSAGTQDFPCSLLIHQEPKILGRPVIFLNYRGAWVIVG